MNGLLARLGGKTIFCLTWGLLPAWGTHRCFGSMLYPVRAEGTLVIARCSLGQCGALSGGVADLLEGLQPRKTLPPAAEPFLGKAVG